MGPRANEYAVFKAHMDYVTKHGEYSHDGRPNTLNAEGKDGLLVALYREHKQPRYDLYSDLINGTPAESAQHGQ